MRVVEAELEGCDWVFDCGAGRGEQSVWFTSMGLNIVAIDWDECRNRPKHDQIEWWEMSFREAASSIMRDRDVWRPRLETAAAFCGWPPNASAPDLPSLLSLVPKVFYVGSTFDATTCGDRHFWTMMKRRNVLHHIPHKVNSLIVYGDEIVDREELAEESAGLDEQKVRHYPYDDGAQGRASSRSS